jgi:hypothetical protein
MLPTSRRVRYGGIHGCYIHIELEVATAAPSCADKAIMETEVVPAKDTAHKAEVAAITMVPEGAYKASAASYCGTKAHKAIVHGDVTHNATRAEMMTTPGNGNGTHKATWAVITTIPEDGTLPDDGTHKIGDATKKSVTGDGTHNEAATIIDVASPQESST